MKEITASEFGSLSKQDGVVVFDCYTEWCRPCRQFAPILEKFCIENELKVYKIDIDEHNELASTLNIKTVPTTLWFKDGQLVKTVTGMKDDTELLKILMTVRK